MPSHHNTKLVLRLWPDVNRVYTFIHTYVPGAACFDLAVVYANGNVLHYMDSV